MTVMILDFTDHREVSERCSIYRAATSYRGVERLVLWTAECHVCFEEQSYFGEDYDPADAEAAAVAWGEEHECPIAVQVDES